MKKIISVILILTCVSILSNAQVAIKSSEHPTRIDTSHIQISILTCSAGEDIYTAWGHSAIRVIDSVHHTDFVFNYGTFDFNEPFFLTKFVKGSLQYFMSANEYADFLAAYKFEGRNITEQVLKLDDTEKISWYKALQVNMIGDNRFYLYNFITDNCTTRVKDGLFKNSNIQPVHIPVKSFRSEVVKAPYTQGIPWIGFGIDLLLGAYSDQAPDNYQSGFLPNLLFEQIKSTRHLVTETNTYQNSTTKSTLPSEQQPFVVIVLVLLVYAFCSKWKHSFTQTIAKALDIILLALFGIGGCLVFYMSLISLHTACYQNFNLMWLHPAYLIALVLYFLPKKWIGKIGMLFFSAIIALVITSYWLPQHFSKEVFAMMSIALLLNYRLITKGHDTKFI